VTLERLFGYPEHDRQPLLDGINDPAGHLWGRVPVVDAHRAALVLPAA
jgi:hypothetical protein